MGVEGSAMIIWYQSNYAGFRNVITTQVFTNDALHYRSRGGASEQCDGFPWFDLQCISSLYVNQYGFVKLCDWLPDEWMLKRNSQIIHKIRGDNSGWFNAITIANAKKHSVDIGHIVYIKNLLRLFKPYSWMISWRPSALVYCFKITNCIDVFK